MRRFLILIVSIIVLVNSAICQVSDIKKASSSRSSSSENGGIGSATAAAAFEVLNLSVNALIEWQRVKLQDRAENPSIVSFEIMAVAAVQPSTYYIVNPRVRGNWGLFSTDFRLNYLIEEGLDGVRHIRTDDWQVIELNIITAPKVNFYVGWGFLHEAFGEGAYHNEWTTCLRISPSRTPFKVQAEYRHSVPRIEVNGNIQYPILTRAKSGIYLMVGGAFQQYYSSITVWGIQGGIMVKLH
jgi:hypothetical protein